MDLDVEVHIAAPPLPAPPHGSEPTTHRLSDVLPDVLRDNLDVVFVGTAAGWRSAERGIYYANPGNNFWPALRQVELVPARFDMLSFARLPLLGIGLTDLSKTARGMDADVVVTREELAAFTQKMREHTPRAIAFTSKRAASLWLRRRGDRIRYGRQKQRGSDFCEVFVLPSPSPAARRYWNIAPWHELSDWLRATKPWRF